MGRLTHHRIRAFVPEQQLKLLIAASWRREGPAARVEVSLSAPQSSAGTHWPLSARRSALLMTAYGESSPSASAFAYARICPQSGPLPRLCQKALPSRACSYADGRPIVPPGPQAAFRSRAEPGSAQCSPRRNEMFSHIMIGSNDIARSKKFYDALFAAMGAPLGVEDARGAPSLLGQWLPLHGHQTHRWQAGDDP